MPFTADRGIADAGGLAFEKSFNVRFRIDFHKHCSIGIGKMELLEGLIHRGACIGTRRSGGSGPPIRSAGRS
jgi:hypothetical protein